MMMMSSSLIRIPPPFWSTGRSTTTTTSSSSLTHISTRRQQPPAILLSSSSYGGQKKKLSSSSRRLEPLLPKSITTTTTDSYDHQTDTEFHEALAAYDGGLRPSTLINLLIHSLPPHGVRVVFCDQNTPSDLRISLNKSDSIESAFQHGTTAFSAFQHGTTAFSAAMGYARFSDGRPGVCFVSSLSCAHMEYAKRHGIPVVAILPAFNAATADTGTLAALAAAAANRTYLVADMEDIPRIVRQAFASVSFPPCVGGPVVIKIEEKLSVTNSRVLSHKLEPILDIIADSRKPLVCIDNLEDYDLIKRFVELTGGIPIAFVSRETTLHHFPEKGYHSLSANISGHWVDSAIEESDLLLAFGLELDNANGNPAIFGGIKTVVHIVGNYQYLPWCQRKLLLIPSNVTLAIAEMVRLLEERKRTASLRHSILPAWRKGLIFSIEPNKVVAAKEEEVVAAEEKLIPVEPHHVTQVLSELVTGEAVISTGGIDHSETGAAEFFRHIKPTQHTELSLAEVIGVAAARPDAFVVHIDGDGWYSPRIANQDFDAIESSGMTVVVILLNHEDRDRAGTKSEYSDRKPTFRVTKKIELRTAIWYMLDFGCRNLVVEVVIPKHASFCGSGGPSAVNKISE